VRTTRSILSSRRMTADTNGNPKKETKDATTL
jgi:hypothetical protein